MDFDPSQLVPIQQSNPWKIDPQVQAERDAKGAALRAQYDNNPAYEGPSISGIEDQVAKVAGKGTSQKMAFDPSQLVPIDAFDPSQLVPIQKTKEPIAGNPDIHDLELPLMQPASNRSASDNFRAFSQSPIGKPLVGIASKTADSAVGAFNKAVEQGYNSPDTQGQDIYQNVVGATVGGFAGLVQMVGTVWDHAALQLDNFVMQKHIPDAELLKEQAKKGPAAKMIEDFLDNTLGLLVDTHSPNYEASQEMLGAPFDALTKQAGETGGSKAQFLSEVMLLWWAKRSLKRSKPDIVDKFENPNLVIPKKTEEVAKGSETSKAPEITGQGELPLAGEEQLRTQTPYGDLSKELPKDEYGIGYNPELSADVQAHGRATDLFNVQEKLKAPDTRASLLKQAEIEDTWRKHGLSDKEIEVQKNELWARQEYDRPLEEQAKQHFIDQPFEENRPTQMEMAFKKANKETGNFKPEMFEEFGKLTSKLLAKIASRPGDATDTQLSFLKDKLLEKLDTVGFDDPKGIQYQEAANKIHGEIQRRDMALQDDLYKAQVEAAGHKYEVGNKVLLPSNNGGNVGTILAKTIAENNKNAYVIDFNGIKIRLPEDQLLGKAGGLSLVDPKQRGMLNVDAFKSKDGDPHFWSKFVFGAGVSTEKFLELFDKPTVDTKRRIGLSTASFRASTPLIKAIGTAAESSYAVLVHIDNKIREAISIEHKKNSLHFPVIQEINQMYGINMPKLLVKPEKLRLFQNDIRIRLDMEKNPEKFGFDGTNFVPNKDQLISAGMSEKSAGVWEKIGKLDEEAWKTASESAKMNDIPLPPRVPFYLHHEWKGPYRVILNIINPENPNGKQYLYEHNAYSLKEAQSVHKEFEKIVSANPGMNLELSLEKPTAEGKGTNSLISAMWEINSKVKNPALAALLETIYRSASRGMITQLLERNINPKGGYLLERAGLPMDSLAGLTKKQMIDAVRSIQRNWETENGYNARAKFVNETLFPLVTAGYLEHPALQETAKTRIHAFMKVGDVLEAKVDNFIKQGLIDQGLDPGIAHHIQNVGMGWASKYFLFGKASFYAVNFFQAVNGIAAGLMMKSFQQLVGEKSGSIMKALIDSRKDIKDAAIMNIKNPLIKEAVDRGFTDPAYIQSIDPSQIKDKVALGLDQRTRTNAFVMGYHLFKQTMSHEEAITSAGKYADLVGIPYTKTMGAPTWFSQLSLIERPLVMFMTYSQHMFGFLNQQLAIASRGLSEKNYKAVSTVFASIAALNGINYALFGISSLPYTANYDEIIRMLNLNFGTMFPTVKEVSRNIDQNMPDEFKGINSYGMVSKMLGYDVSSSAGGPNVQASAAVLDFLSIPIQSAMLTGQWAYGKKPVTKEQMYAFTKELSPVPAAAAEFMIKSGSFFPDEPDYSPTRNIGVERGIERTKQQSWMRFYTGLKSLDEKEFDMSYNINAQHQKVINDTANAIIQSAKEGKTITPKEMQQLINLAKDYGKDIGPVLDAIMEAQITKGMSPDEREQRAGGTSTENFLKYKRLEDLRRMEINRRH